MCVASLLILGSAVAVVGVGSNGFKNWDTSTWFKDAFSGVQIESKVFEYDGENKVLDIVVPENATYELTITNSNNEIVDSCIEIGIYNYKVVVKIGDLTKEYNATLEIVENLNEVTEETIVNVSNVNGLRFVQKAAVNNGDGTFTETITYTTNGDVTNNFYVTLAWSQDYVDDVYNYYSVDLSLESKTISITNKKACPKQATLKIVHNDDPSINASLTIDYKVKKLSSASITISGGENSILQDGLNLVPSITAPTYSVGSIDIARESENFSVSGNMNWASASGYSGVGQILSLSTELYTAYSDYKYKGTNYDSSTDLLKAMQSEITNAFNSIYSLSDKTISFNFSALKEALTYQYSYKTFTINYSNANLYSEFINEFSTLCSSRGSSYRVTFSAYGVNKSIDFKNLSMTTLSGGISLDNESIVF